MYSMDKCYTVGAGKNEACLTAYPQAALRDLAYTIFEACGEPIPRREVGADIQETADGLVTRCGPEAALMFAREALADLTLHRSAQARSNSSERRAR